MVKIESREPNSILLQAHLIMATGDRQLVEVRCSVEFDQSKNLCLPEERYRSIMLEGAQQADMPNIHIATIEKEMTPYTPEASPEERVLFPTGRGVQREYTREQVLGKPWHATFYSKVIFLDTTNEKVLRLRIEKLNMPIKWLRNDSWAGRDCTRFMQLQFYHPRYGEPPVAPELEHDYRQWLEDTAIRLGFLLGFVQIGTLTADAASEIPPESVPNRPSEGFSTTPIPKLQSGL
jgi:hypothetical protein